jgi:hypothetical protein
MIVAGTHPNSEILEKTYLYSCVFAQKHIAIARLPPTTTSPAPAFSLSPLLYPALEFTLATRPSEGKGLSNS